jgi:hypothetical protein
MGREPVLDDEVRQDLREHGALVVDLLLCRNLEPINVFLREGPVGLQQLVFYDGALFFGRDYRYRVKYHTACRRDPQGSVLAPKQEASLRELMAAIHTFSHLRGRSLAILELTGVPLGPEQWPTNPHPAAWGVPRALVVTLGRSLQCLPSLQRLHLASSSLHDQGLRVLLPHLASGLPKLSHLSLAKNKLQDTKLIAYFLQERARRQRKRQVVPLCILDLSENPRLGTKLGRGKDSQPQSRGGDPLLERQLRNEAHTDSKGRRGIASLLSKICDAICQGLLLRTLRLRSMGVCKDDLRPLLHLLYREVARRQAGQFVDFPLEEVSLEDNPLEPEFPSAVRSALAKLSYEELQKGCASAENSASVDAMAPHYDRSTVSYVGSQKSRPRPVRSKSMPLLPVELGRRLDDVSELRLRDCVSECDADEDHQVSTDPQSRARFKREMSSECAAIGRLEEFRVSRAPANSEHERQLEEGTAQRAMGMVYQREPHAGSWARAGPHSLYSESGSLSGDEFGVIKVHEIPDKSFECGFGCGGLLPDTGSDSDDEADAGPEIVVSGSRGGTRGVFPDRQRSPPTTCAGGTVEPLVSVGAGERHSPSGGSRGGITADVASSNSPPAHIRLDMLHQLFQQSVDSGMHGGPEMLQYALEVVSSDASLDLGACQEAFLSMLEDRRRAQEEREASGRRTRTTAQRDESSAEGEDERLSDQALLERRVGWHQPRVGPRHLGFSSHASI